MTTEQIIDKWQRRLQSGRQNYIDYIIGRKPRKAIMKYAIITPLAGGSDYELCLCESQEKALEVARILLSQGDGGPRWVRIERRE